MEYLKKLMIVLIILMAPFYNLSAQYNVYGVVTNNEMTKTVENVDVVLSHDGQTLSECKTDSNGQFSFQVEKDKDYSIFFSSDQDGMTEVQVQNVTGNTDLGYCVLNKATDLQEVTVEAEPVRSVKGKLLISPTTFQTSISTKAIDLLGKLAIPGVLYNVVNKTITVEGGNPVILINGAPASQEQLQHINAKNVLNIEYTRNVPPMYRGQGDCLKNVRLKERDAGGNLSVGIDSDVLLTSSNGNFSLSYNQGKSEWRAFYSANHRNFRHAEDEYREQFLNPLRPIDIVENDSIHFSYWSQSASLVYTYIPSSKFFLQTQLNYNYLDKHSIGKGVVNSTEYGLYEKFPVDNLRFDDVTVDVYGRYDINNKNILELDFTGRYYRGNSISSNENIGDLINEYFDESTDSRRYSLISNLQYKHSFTNSELYVSYRNTYSYTKNIYPEQGDARLNDNENYIGAMYQIGFGPVWISLKSGLNFESRNLNSSSTTWQYSNLSTAELSWSMTKNWRTEAGFGFIPSIPAINSQMAPTRQISPYLYVCSDPDLKRGSTLNARWALYFNKDIWSFSTILKYSRTNNPLANVTGFDTEKNMYYMRTENINSTESAVSWINFGMNGLLNKFFLNGGLQIVYGHTKVKDWSKCGWGVGGSVQAIAQFGKWQVGATGIFPVYQFFHMVRSYSNEPFTQIFTQFRPNSHWTFSTSLRYFYAQGYHWKSQLYAPDYEKYAYRKFNDGWSVRFAVEYDLTFGRIFKSKGRSIQNRDSQTGIFSTGSF